MATFAPGGQIDVAAVEIEINRLKHLWSEVVPTDVALEEYLGSEAVQAVDPFGRVQLAEVIRICRRSRSLSEAGRLLFSASRSRRSSSNDVGRPRKSLQRFNLDWS